MSPFVIFTLGIALGCIVTYAIYRLVWLPDIIADAKTAVKQAAYDQYIADKAYFVVTTEALLSYKIKSFTVNEVDCEINFVTDQGVYRVTLDGVKDVFRYSVNGNSGKSRGQNNAHNNGKGNNGQQLTRAERRALEKFRQQQNKQQGNPHEPMIDYEDDPTLDDPNFYN